MRRLWPVGLLPLMAALVVAAAVVHAQLDDSQSAGGTINAAIGTAPPTGTPGPSPTPPAGYDAAVAVGSAAAPPNSQVTVDLTLAVAPGVMVSVLEVTVTYDNAVITALSCEATPSSGLGHCDSGSLPSSVMFNMASVCSVCGLSGDIGDITFSTLSMGGWSALTVEVQACDDTVGGPLSCFAQNGVITISSPTPTPSPTATPGAITPTPSPAATVVVISPTPSPRPGVQGDVDCSGGDTPVTVIDALNVLRFVAGLPVTQTELCDYIGTGGPPVQGDVDCSGGLTPVTAVDALKILRYVAGLSVSKPETCPGLGT